MQTTFARLATIVAVVVVAFVLGRCTTGGGRDLVNGPVVVKQIQALSELVTVKYVTEQVVTHEIEGIFGKDKILLIAHGIVKAGVDLSKVSEKDVLIDRTTSVISIHLPPSSVTDRYLDGKRTRVYDRSTGTFKSPEPHLETEARRIAETAILSAAHAAGIHREADKRARELVARMAMLMGYERIEFH